MDEQLNSLVNLLKSKSLQKTLKVLSFVDCTIKEPDVFIHKLVYNIKKNHKEVIVLKNNENNTNHSKSMSIIDANITYLLTENIFTQDIFKSKYNQEILKISSLMNEDEFKNLEMVIFNSTNIFDEFTSKILKISDNILILADTSEESLKKVISKLSNDMLKGQTFNVIMLGDNKNLNWDEYSKNFIYKIKQICEVEINIFDIVMNHNSNIDLYKTGEKLYLHNITNSESKNKNFFDFIVNILN